MAAVVALAGANGASAQDVPVPSGRVVTLFDVVIEAQPDIARFRFLSPEVASPDWHLEEMVADMKALCDTIALPALQANGVRPGEIVLSVSAEEVPFGTIAPGVAQVFHVFREQQGSCEVEFF